MQEFLRISRHFLYAAGMNQAQAREHIAAEVRAELARQRISVSEAARRLGWTQTFLQRRVMGNRTFEASELAMIADLLEVPVSTFFEVPGGLRRPARYTPRADLPLLIGAAA
jgi:transcriptional regulator with XRE-family HTH domain